MREIQGQDYEVFASRGVADEWRVEAIDEGSEGQVYVAIFSGPRARERAEEYAEWKRGTERSARRNLRTPADTIARLTRERDEARAQVDKAEKQAAYNAAVAASLADQVNELLAEFKDQLDKGSERYNRVAALVEKWRDSKYLRDRTRHGYDSLDCADELEQELKAGEPDPRLQQIIADLDEALSVPSALKDHGYCDECGADHRREVLLNRAALSLIRRRLAMLAPAASSGAPPQEPERIALAAVAAADTIARLTRERDEALARLDRVRKLVQKWRDSEYLLGRIRHGYDSLDCADELDAALAVGEAEEKGGF